MSDQESVEIPFYEWAFIEKKIEPCIVGYNKGKVTKFELENTYDKILKELEDKYSKKRGCKLWI